ncbi:MAG: hypothetical protein LBT00_02830 [Spirochaetaceae bacterium]|jgi:hypothetical protein|nr:hypothetical protein [Spirochaetaceae bacterium]
MLPRVRNDEPATCLAMTMPPVIVGGLPVIASVAKQSSERMPLLDCFTNGNGVAAGSQ